MRKEDGPAKKWNYKSFRAAPSARPTVPLVNSQYFRVVLNSANGQALSFTVGQSLRTGFSWVRQLLLAKDNFQINAAVSCMKPVFLLIEAAGALVLQEEEEVHKSIILFH